MLAEDWGKGDGVTGKRKEEEPKVCKSDSGTVFHALDTTNASGPACHMKFVPVQLTRQEPETLGLRACKKCYAAK
jgi:hypothetical protein